MPGEPHSALTPAAERLVRFYRNQAPDHAGRMLEEILNWSDEALERTHDYIQWLFPNRDPSPVNPLAPTVDDSAVSAFAADADLRANLQRAFERMARFYGLAIQREGQRMRIIRSPQWPQRSANWLTSGNHNLLRITRILKCLRLLGLEATAAAFFEALQAIYHAPEGRAIGSRSFNFWRDAAEG